MNSYETSATVEAQGQVSLAGLPFEPGTRVDVVVTPVEKEHSSSASDVAARAQRLLSALDQARNTEPVGPLKRSELYDRDVLR